MMSDGVMCWDVVCWDVVCWDVVTYVSVCITYVSVCYAILFDIANQTIIHIVNDNSTGNKQDQKFALVAVDRGLSPGPLEIPPNIPLQRSKSSPT